MDKGVINNESNSQNTPDYGADHSRMHKDPSRKVFPLLKPGG